MTELTDRLECLPSYLNEHAVQLDARDLVATAKQVRDWSTAVDEAAAEIDRLTGEVSRTEKSNRILRDLWEKNKIRHTKDGCSCRFEENGDLLESCKFHGDDKAKADALAETVEARLQSRSLQEDDKTIAAMRAALTAYRNK